MVTLYTQPRCPRCVFVKKALTANEVAHKTVDITKDERAREILVSAGVKATPVLEVNGKLITDFDDMLNFGGN